MFKFKNINILNWKLIGNFDIKVDITPGNHTFIKVRKCDSNISTAILMLHKKLFQLKGNSRGNKSGDLGVMHSLGKKNQHEEYVTSKNNIEIQMLMLNIGTLRKKWFRNEFPIDYENFFSTCNKIEYMKDSLSDFMVHSVALSNSSHYDINDATITVSTWVEETLENTENWFLIFPNVTYDNKNATIIQLFHGCTVTWDASIIRHASSKLSYRIRGGGTSAGNCELRKKL